MKSLPRLLLTGLLTILPVVITLAILVWLASFLEAMLGGLLAWLLPDGAYRTGMGLAASLVLIIVLGAVMTTWLAQRLLDAFERAMLRVPLINSLYGAVKDVTALFSPENKRQFSTVVAFRLPGSDARVIGFVTRDDCTDLPPGIDGPELVAVYLPMSYQVGGYTLLLPRTQLEPIDMASADALRFTLTAGVTRSAKPATTDPPQQTAG